MNRAQCLKTRGNSADGSNGLVYFYYVPQGGYAPNGNLLVHSDFVMGDWFFNYDAADRLVSATPDTTVPTQYQGKYGCWSYDAFGNRTLEAFSIATCGSNPTPQIRAVINSANNQIQSVSGTTSATFTYDASGNTLYDGVNHYWYDAEGQLCAVQRATGGAIYQYVYDAGGARIAKGTLASAPSNYTSSCAPPLGSGFTLTNQYLVDLGGDQVTELTGPVGSQVWAHSNVWAGGKLTATYDSNSGHGGIHIELADPLGTKRVQLNAVGVVEETCTSLPFGNDVGNPLAAGCTLPNPPATSDDATEHHFTQKERDTESGNDYFFARYYTSALGRFTTPDWSAKVVPVPYAAMGDPQSLNLYAYVRNNPLAGVDEDGHCDGWACQEAMQSAAEKQLDMQAQENAKQDAQKKAQAQNAASSGTTEGTPFKPIQTGGTTVTGTFDAFGSIGVTIHATPSNCGDCQWMQQAVELGGGDHSWDNGHKPFIDGQDVMGKIPLMGKGGCGSNCLDDQPTRPIGPYPAAFSAVAVFGHADSANHTFRGIGAIAYGFSISSNGALTPHGPVAASTSQMSGVIKQAAHMSKYSGWSIR